jgi:hypothetical protein
MNLVILFGPEEPIESLASHMNGVNWHGTGVGYGLRGAAIPELTMQLEGEFTYMNGLSVVRLSHGIRQMCCSYTVIKHQTHHSCSTTIRTASCGLLDDVCHFEATALAGLGNYW